MRRVSVSNIVAVLAALWVGAYCSGCATAQPAETAEPPRLYCLNMGRVPDSTWWVYACTFIGGDSTTVPSPENLPIASGGITDQ